MKPNTPSTSIERLDAVFQKVVEADVDCRNEVLAKECNGDRELHDQVTRLLAADEDTDAFLDSGGAVSAILDAGLPQRGDRLGKFVLGDEVGRGGMGIVFRADQVEPFQRRVAIKVLNGISLNFEGRARFEAEKHVLATLEHMNITRIHDAGITDSGIGYIAMEYVEGIPLTRYCVNHSLSTRQRLELFQQVCQAVDYLHQKKVIHRDIKPSNVLVKRSGDSHVPKLIDFGVAKFTSHANADAPATRTGFMIGTPQYMCPEQAMLRDGVSPDERADVYSLGVTLYELLIGRPPIEFDPATDGLLQVLQSIRDGEFPIPSVMLRAEQARSDTAQENSQALLRDLRSGLDAVVMKAMAVAPDHRYQSPSALSDDIQHFLDGKPVAASLPGPIQHATKWISRHRTATAISIGFAVLCGLLLTMATLASANAASERKARTTIQLQIDQVALNRRAFRAAYQEYQRLAMEEYEKYVPGSMGLPGLTGMPEADEFDTDPMFVVSNGLRNIAPWMSWDERAATLPVLTTPFSSQPALGASNQFETHGFFGTLFGAIIQAESVDAMDGMPADAFEQMTLFVESLVAKQEKMPNQNSMMLFDSYSTLAQIYLMADLPEEASTISQKSLSIDLPDEQLARQLLAKVIQLIAQIELDRDARKSLKNEIAELADQISQVDNKVAQEQLQDIYRRLKRS